MNSVLATALLIGTCLNLSFLVVLWLRTRSRSLATEVRNDLRLAREEARAASKDSRDDSARAMQSINAQLQNHGTLQQNHFAGIATQLNDFSEASRASADTFRSMLDSRIHSMQDANEAKLDEVRKVLELVRDTVDQKLNRVSEQVAAGMQANSEAVTLTLDRMSRAQVMQLEQMTKQVNELSETNHTTLDRIRGTLDVRVQELQAANERSFAAVSTSVADTLNCGSDAMQKALVAASTAQHGELEAMTRQIKDLSEQSKSALDRIHQNLDVNVKEMRAGNEQKLEEMRRTVDEKLHDTLERRLGESFKLVSDRLDTVHRGLGEMQGLASGVGDLRRMLTNVKIRGTWGEVQLASILSDILATDQWSKNVCVRDGSAERVECAVRLPGPKGDPNACLWLPIDSKFPQEDYARLQTAADGGDTTQVQIAQEGLFRTIQSAAKDVHDKYINPPATTDFAIMFLATEGLYAEVLREPGLAQELLTRHRVAIAGPTTLAALLTSLRVGFQTLAIEQRADEVWRVLGAIKTEFSKFGGVLAKVQRQLQTASRTIEDAGTRTRAMERKLRSVEQLESTESATILALPSSDNATVEQDEDLTDLASTDDADDAANVPELTLKPTGSGLN